MVQQFKTTLLRGLASIALLSIYTFPQDEAGKTNGQEEARKVARAFIAHPLEHSAKALALGRSLRVGVEEYQSYLLALMGRTWLEELVFDRLLTMEIAQNKKAQLSDGMKAAMASAVAMANARIKKLGKKAPTHARTRFANEALRDLRVAALVKTKRRASRADLIRIFEQIHGVDGQKVRLRHILVSFAATRKRLLARNGNEPTRQAIEDAALERATGLRKEIEAGKDFASLLANSDEPATQSLLAHPDFKGEAGRIPDYNYQRYGTAFAEAVRAMPAQTVSKVKKTSHGYHIIELESRTLTRFEDVRKDILARFHAAAVSLAEQNALRRRLLTKYAVKIEN